MDVTDADFEAQVLDRSLTTAVVVDLWAEWCGPCKTLGPILEKVVAETDGKVTLVKVDIDANPGVANAFKVQSIPAVFAIKDKAVVDSFIGALPEAQVRAFVERLAPPKTEADLLVEKGDETSLREALALKPDHAAAVVGLAELLVAKDDQASRDEALALLARIPESAETRRVAALARVGEGALDAAATAEIEVKLTALLDKVKTDDDARQEYVDLLEVMGPDDPRTATYRKALTARLF